jgi:hypothetical protein
VRQVQNKTEQQDNRERDNHRKESQMGEQCEQAGRHCRCAVRQAGRQVDRQSGRQCRCAVRQAGSRAGKKAGGWAGLLLSLLITGDFLHGEEKMPHR